MSSLWRTAAGRRAGRAGASIAAAAGLLAAAMLLGVPEPQHDAAFAASPKPAPSWLVKSNDLILLQQQAAADGVTLPAFTWIGCGGDSDPDRCVAGQQPIFTSYWALRSRALTGWRGTAIFDIETWSYTPPAQRKNPDEWICRAARLTRVDSHLKVIITPYAKPPAKRIIGEDVAAARCGGYAVDVQSQFINASPAKFGRFIRKDVMAVRRVNHKIIMLAGLATNNPTVQTVAHLTADYRKALAAGVEGFWLNAANWGRRNHCTAAQGGPGCPQTGVRFLEEIGLAQS